jgi:hypothetical protein
MLEHIVSYILKTSEWWSAINITNHTFQTTNVLIEYYHNKGYLLSTNDVELRAGCQKKIDVNVEYGWARIISSDNVTVSELIGTTDMLSSVVFSIEGRKLVVGNIVAPDRKLVQFLTSNFIWDIRANCKYLTSEYLTTLTYMARTLDCRFPDRVAKKLEITCGTPLSGDCPGHPVGSHINGVAADFHYFTLGSTNHTQDDPDGNGKIIQIWTDITNPSSTLTDMFDRERNTEFALMLKKVFPDIMLIMDERIKNVLATTAWKMYGDSARNIINAAIQGDTPMHMNHHTHMHCDYKNVINWTATL